MMSGCTIPYTPVAVDFWKSRKCSKVSLFFLSHVQLDQSCGLSSNWVLPIYCSSVSKKLLIHLFQLNANLIHALALDVPHVIPMTSSGDVTMTVTLIDARHCPGSVTFLFDGYFGRILYTGHFRYEEGMLNERCLSALRSNPVDVLYIDNTFCSPKCVLPSRQEAKRQIISIIEQHPKERVVFGLCGLGKEEILISLAKWFDVKITVSEERYRLLKVLALHERFVMACERFEQTRFEVVELVEITRSNVDSWSKSAPTIAIVLTGLFVGLGYQPFSGSSDIFVVPLSDHSPYTELHEFMARIRPKSVVPIVRTDPGSRDDPLAASLLDRTNVECFTEHLDPSPMQNYHIPPSVLEMMNRTGNARSRTCKQSSNCRTSVSSTKSRVSSSGQKLSPDSSASQELASASSIKTSDSKSDCAQCKRMNSCNVVTRGIAEKPRVAVRPMKRCLPPDQSLQSRLIKQRRHHWVNFPTLSELQRKRFSTNAVLQQECKRLLVSTCMANSGVPSMTSKLSVIPSARKQGNGTSERQPDVSVTSNVACHLRSTCNHVESASGSGDTESKNHTDSLWQSSDNSVLRFAEPQANTGVTMANFAVCHHEGSEHIKETNTLGYVLPTVTLLNHSVNRINQLAHNADGALNLTTSGVTNRQPSFPEVQYSSSLLPNTFTSTVKHLDDSLRQLGNDNSSVYDDLQVQAISDSSEQPRLIQGSADTATLHFLVDATSAPRKSLSCNHDADETKRGTGIEIDRIYHHPVGNEYLKLSQNPHTSSCNIALPINTESINRPEELCTRERHPSTHLTVGVIFDNHCETAVFAGNKNTANAVAVVHSGLPGVTDASRNHTSEVLRISGVEREIGTQCAPKSNADLSTNTCKQGKSWCNLGVASSTHVVSLPPKKKWRKRFRATQVHRSHQENLQLNVCEGQKLTVDLPLVAPESSKMNHDGFALGSSISALNLCPQSSACMGGKRVPLLTNCSAGAADITSRFAACTSCHCSANTVPRATTVSCRAASDWVLWRTPISSGNDKANPVKEQPTSPKWNQQKSAVVTTLPLDLSVCCKSGRHDCRLAEDASSTVSDATMFC